MFSKAERIKQLEFEVQYLKESMAKMELTLNKLWAEKHPPTMGGK